MEYIDVRGPWPIYINGLKAQSLQPALRSISIETARQIVNADAKETQTP